jgi:hypothetical protein
MTFEHDPPLLRALGQELPGELSRALESSPAEEADPRELARLRENVLHALSRVERPMARPHLRVRSRALSLALTFALGAGAGTVVSTGLVYWHRAAAPGRAPNHQEFSPEQSARPPHSAEPARPRPEAARSSEPAVPEPTAPRPEAPTGSRRSPSTPPETQGAPADELAILARAQAALTNSPKAALALVAEHERTFAGSGLLAQEREVIAIDALLRLGRTTEAESRARRFHRRFPGSAHGRRVDVLFEVR